MSTVSVKIIYEIDLFKTEPLQNENGKLNYLKINNNHVSTACKHIYLVT
jgi:hypothetical protein